MLREHVVCSVNLEQICVKLVRLGPIRLAHSLTWNANDRLLLLGVVDFWRLARLDIDALPELGLHPGHLPNHLGGNLRRLQWAQLGRCLAEQYLRNGKRRVRNGVEVITALTPLSITQPCFILDDPPRARRRLCLQPGHTACASCDHMPAE